MCGIVGLWNYAQANSKHELRAFVIRMAERLVHRGPDDCGSWVDERLGLALGHRRLSIIDLSSAGRQPMISSDGRFIIVFNGEIYNYEEIKHVLEMSSSVPWRGASDTEVMLEAFSRWGIKESVDRFTGMFSFAVWDRQEQSLSLVRDRLGEKPLYYGLMNGCFIFGSELKALQRHPEWRSGIDRDALALYIRHNYIPAPYTIYRGMKKLIPGSILKITGNVLKLGCLPEPVPYWSAKQAIVSGRNNPFIGSDDGAVDELDRILTTAVRKEMVSDVPLGAFLSGGIDSSIIVALMQVQSERPVKTFTIGFTEQDYNEADDAKAVARHLGTEHTELYITPEDAMALIPRLPNIFDEPFSDVSQIPTYLVAEMTRKHVTVSLSGDGGDELFGGYSRYFLAERFWRYASPLPYPLRKTISAMLLAPSTMRWNQLLSILTPFIPDRFQRSHIGSLIHKLAVLLSREDRVSLYKHLVSHWSEPEGIVKNGWEPATSFRNAGENNQFSFIENMMYLDTVSYLPDDILVKVDRACMAVSLESRAPFLDHQVFEFAWMLPIRMKVQNGSGKIILKKLLERYVPRELTNRPKMGFGVPIDAWLRGPLRDWAEALLDENRIEREGYLYAAPIRDKWHEHLSGKRNWQYHLWGILMFQVWLEEQNQKRP